jgi:hypothetical protein
LRWLSARRIVRARNAGARTEIPAKQLLAWLELASGKFHQGRKRYGRFNEHNARCPRAHWLA